MGDMWVRMFQFVTNSFIALPFCDDLLPEQVFNAGYGTDSSHVDVTSLFTRGQSINSAHAHNLFPAACVYAVTLQ